MAKKAQRRNDVSPPGWEGTTEAMKSHGEISNPFALAWWMQEQGFHPHDALNKDVLDAACEQFTKHGHNDGTPYVTAGAKEGNGRPADKWMAQTENLEEIPEHEDDDSETEHDDGFIPGIVHSESEHEPMSGPGAEEGQGGMHFGKEDSDEMLLDDSESEHFGADYPTGPTPNVSPNAAHGTHGTISDPAPENYGGEALTHEAQDDDETEHDDDDDDDAHHDDDDDDEHADDDDDEARRDE